MKKIIITLVSCLVAIAPVFAQNRIVKSFANLRTQSNVNSTVIEIIPRGERVYVVGDYAGGWSQVIYNYKVGVRSYFNPDFREKPHIYFLDKSPLLHQLRRAKSSVSNLLSVCASWSNSPLR